MKKIVFLSSLVLAATVVAAPGAFAQDEQLTGPDPVACAEAGRKVDEARKLLDQDKAHRDAVAALEAAAASASAANVAPASGDLVNDTGGVTPADVQAQISRLEAIPEPDRTNAIEAELAADKALLVAVNAEVAAKAALDKTPAVDAEALQQLARDGGLPALITAQSTACSQEPEPPAFVDLDCPDFPLPDGRTAQDVLNADATDPHKLDIDGDKIACEIDEPADNNSGNGSGTGGDFDQVGSVPVGGVATGGGPA